MVRFRRIHRPRPGPYQSCRGPGDRPARSHLNCSHPGCPREPWRYRLPTRVTPFPLLRSRATVDILSANARCLSAATWPPDPVDDAPAGHADQPNQPVVAGWLEGANSAAVGVSLPLTKVSAIAGRLELSLHTMHTHGERLHRKLSVRSGPELIVQILTTFLLMTAKPDSPLPPICPNRAAGRCP